MPTIEKILKKFSTPFLYLSVVLNLVFYFYISRQNELLLERAKLYNFLTEPILSSKSFEEKEFQKLNKALIRRSLISKSFCTVHENIAIKVFFSHDHTLQVFLRELTERVIKGPFTEKPTFILPYLITNSTISWTIPLPGKLKYWLVKPFIGQVTNEVFLRTEKLRLTPKNCSYLSDVSAPREAAL